MRMRIGILGASFDTGNMGVSALAESSIKVVLSRWPNAEIVLMRSSGVTAEQNLCIMGKKVSLNTLPIRFSKNIFLPYHFLQYVFYGLLAKVLPQSGIRNRLLNHNPYFKTLYEMDFVADITGGDSFSDIYRFRRFFLGFLSKWLVIFLGKKLILLPQTYGPFKRRISRIMARHILNRASLVYSRDQAGVEYVNALLNNRRNRKVRFAPDVAFILDPRRPDNREIDSLEKIRTSNRILVGLNVSGLLYCGGYTRNNMFGLRSNYRELIYAVIEMLLKNEGASVLLIPHVFPPAGYEGESDPQACLKVYEELNGKYPGRIFLIRGCYNHNEIKYIIGLCSFFIGSRMHACIAAISQNVPAIGLAYSNKFEGVFERVGMGELAIDLRAETEDALLSRIRQAFARRDKIAAELSVMVPRVQKEVLGIFDGSCELL